jgi:hypothetical protein
MSISLKDIEIVIVGKIKGKSLVGIDLDVLTNMVKEHLDDFNIATIKQEVTSAVENLVKSGQLAITAAGDIIDSKIG